MSKSFMNKWAGAIANVTSKPQPIRLLDLASVQKLEDALRLHTAPNQPYAPWIDRLIVSVSQELFGLTHEETYFVEPENFEYLTVDQQDEIDAAFEIHERRIGADEEPEALVPILLDRGVDFRDSFGRPLLCTPHLVRQAMLATSGAAGRIPDRSTIVAVKFGEKLQEEAAAFLAKKRKERLK